MAYFTLVTNTKSYIGASTDTEPTTGVPAGCRAWVTDTRWEYIYDGTTWHKISRSTR